MTAVEDVVIVGAGPYGLSLAAHLRAAGVRYRHFGRSMELWRTAMPQGMFLKSQGFASNLSEPGRRDTLEAFCRDHGLRYGRNVPVPLDTFVRYGSWFADRHAADLEEQLVQDIRRDDGRFVVTLADGERVHARRVVIATGVQHFAYTPWVLSTLPPEAVTHASDHADLAVFRDRRVAVIGAGQSALESAALLHENGSDVTLVVRKGRLAWNPEPPAGGASPYRLRPPESMLGPGWISWVYSTQPSLLRRMPSEWRIRTARTALGPAGAHWLRPRVEGRVRTLLGHSVRSVSAQDGGVRLDLQVAGDGVRQLDVDHVLAATGYRASLHRLAFLDEELRKIGRAHV